MLTKALRRACELSRGPAQGLLAALSPGIAAHVIVTVVLASLAEVLCGHGVDSVARGACQDEGLMWLLGEGEEVRSCWCDE